MNFSKSQVKFWSWTTCGPQSQAHALQDRDLLNLRGTPKECLKAKRSLTSAYLNNYSIVPPAVQVLAEQSLLAMQGGTKGTMF